ncbi:MAG TPA: PhaM family polyhydroxyalkanoate granule multifunctional regulatory protein [Burkholderiaceae bacterium]
MSDNNLGFGKFVPGFDFLQGLAKQATTGASNAIPQLPNLSSWVAPTLNVEELDKRIEELKAVHFWLDQNSKALGATIQALEVQKMTLATLKGMNFNFADVANAFKLKAGETIGTGLFGGAQKAAEKTADTAKAAVDIASGAAKAVVGASKVATAKPPARKKASAAPAAGVVDPLQWWGALTQQFQGIAASAMKDAARQTAVDTTRNLATGFAKEAIKSATGMAKAATKSVANNAGRTPAKPRKTTKTAARKRS